ncbi:MAG: sulfatase-like hydrolase/transferase [Planctomycetota bacterium]
MQNQSPNILVFFTDQQRHDTTGVHGCPLDLTPHFDRLARAGTDVHYAFTPNPVCGPARACIQTGTYASTNGTYINGLPLTRDLPHLATLLNQAGYHTGYIGKWHLADDHEEPGPVPENHRGGYQSWLAANLLEMTSDEYHTRLWDESNEPVDLPGYRVDALADASIRFIEQRVREHANQPFMLMTSFLEPHHQNHVDDYPPPDGYRERYEGAWIPPDLAALGGSSQAHLGGYFGMVKRIDEALGRMVDALKSLGVLDNTVIAFISDHGCHFKTRNGEYKRSGHDASIRVPMMLHGGPFTGAGRIDQPVSLVDIAPTLLDIAGAAVPETMQGRSLIPLIERDPATTASWPDDAYTQVSEQCWGRAVRTKRWKYILLADETERAAELTGCFMSYREAELYDLRYDPHELTNLVSSDAHTPVRDAMRQRVRRWWSRLGEPDATIIEPSNVRPMGQRRVMLSEVME